jgi:hypothetical protein
VPSAVVGGASAATGGAWQPQLGCAQQPEQQRRPASNRQADVLSTVSRQITKATSN